jgi:hypothetical protein
MSVDQEFARWLREGVLFTAAESAAVAAAWGALARTTEIRSPLALAAGADAEAARQLAFLSGPLVEDLHVVDGLRADLIGQAIVLKANPPDGELANGTRQLGYEMGVTVFVIGVQEHDELEQTTLLVLMVLRKIA